MAGAIDGAAGNNILTGDDDEMSAIVIFGLAQGKLGYLLLHLLALAIAAVEQRGKLPSLGGVLSLGVSAGIGLQRRSGRFELLC